MTYLISWGDCGCTNLYLAILHRTAWDAAGPILERSIPSAALQKCVPCDCEQMDWGWVGFGGPIIYIKGLLCSHKWMEACNMTQQESPTKQGLVSIIHSMLSTLVLLSSIWVLKTSPRPHRYTRRAATHSWGNLCPSVQVYHTRTVTTGQLSWPHLACLSCFYSQASLWWGLCRPFLLVHCR